jgi:ATP synthase F1 delta subunit
MYNEEEVARPYARALAQSAASLKLADRVRGDIEALEAQWEQSPELREWANTYHSWPKHEHEAFVESLWGDTFSHPVRVVLASMSEHQLLGAIPHLIAIFRRLMDAVEGRVNVRFVFAQKPTPETEALLRQKAIKAYGPKTAIEVVLDATLGAGLIVRAEYTQMDGSLAGRLRRLKQAFAKK